MAQNNIPVSYAPLVSLGEDAADGAAQYGTALGLAQNSAAKIRSDLVALVGDPTATPAVAGRQAELNAAKAAKTAATAAARSVESNARAFVASAVGLLKNFLGRQWNSAWAAAGFTEATLAVPDDPLPTLRALAAYYAAHAAHANAPLGQTAAAATAQAEAVSTARTAANVAVTALGQAKQVRDAAQTALRQRLSGLRAELAQLMKDDDARWYAFGFDRPADGEQPSPIQNLVLTAAGPGLVLIDWDDARRAERYSVSRQVLGVDTAPITISTLVRDSETTLSGLPSGKDVMVVVAAINDAGEGPEAQATVRVA